MIPTEFSKIANELLEIAINKRIKYLREYFGPRMIIDPKLITIKDLEKPNNKGISMLDLDKDLIIDQVTLYVGGPHSTATFTAEAVIILVTEAIDRVIQLKTEI